MIQLSVDIDNFFGVLRLVHFSLIWELKHSILFRVLWLGIQLNIRVKMAHTMHNWVIMSFAHDTTDKLMRINLLLRTWQLFRMNGCLSLGCNLRFSQLKFLIDRSRVFLKRRDCLCLRPSLDIRKSIWILHFSSKFI